MRKNEKGEWMVEHHTHYKEIDGYDKTVWMTQSEHMKLHRRLRQEGKCNTPPNVLRKISDQARRRNFKEKNPEYHKNYNSEHREEINNRQRGYNNSHKEQIRIAQEKWREKNKEKIRESQREYMRNYRARKKLEKI